VSGPFELIGDPDAAVCEGDLCTLPDEPEVEDGEDAVPQD
jgi:hypothetical protein